jgi:hypothetical protein
MMRKFPGQKRFSWGICERLLLVCLTLVCSGCFGSGSLLVQGKSVESGRGRFDRYFERVLELKQQVSKMDRDFAKIREPLTDTLKMDAKAKPRRIFARLRAKATKLKGYGVLVNLRLRPLPIVVVDSGTMEKGERAESLMVSVQESAVRALQVIKENVELIEATDMLDRRRDELAERIDNTPSDTDRSLLEREVVGAGKVLSQVRKRLGRLNGVLARYLVGLTMSFDTGASKAKDSKCEDALAGKRPRRRRWGRGRRGRKPAGRAKPKPTPKAGGGFDM